MNYLVLYGKLKKAYLLKITNSEMTDSFQGLTASGL